MTTTIRTVERCNKTDAAKVQKLVEAYNAGEIVPAVVIIDYGSATFALSGSHRLDALQTIHGDEMTLEELEALGLVVVEDAEELWENGTDAARKALDDLRNGHAGEMAEIIVALFDGLYDNSKEALEDQK